MINFIKNLFAKPSDAVVEKDWASQWRKGIESNLLQMNGKITQPMRQSYIVHRCVNLISDTAPKAPINFYRGMEEIEKNHQLRNLFAKPSKHVSYYELLSITTMFYSLYGEAFWYLNQSVGQLTGMSKIPAEIIIVDPRGMKEVLNEDRTLKGWLFNNTIPLTTEEIIHFKSNNPYNPYRGLSKLDSVDFEIKADYKASEFQERFFEAGAVPGFILTTHVDDNTPEKELRKIGKAWDMNHAGVSKSHKTAVLRGGMDFKVVGLSHKEMDFIESRIMTRDIILETFGVPKTIFGATEGVNRATAEVQERVFWETTIQPLLLRIESKLNCEFINYIDPSIKVKFDFTKVPVLQNLYTEDVESVWKLIQVGFSRNELNERFDLGFRPDKETGDDKYMMMNLINVSEDIEFAPIPEEPKPVVEDEEEESKSIEKSRRQTQTKKRFLRYHYQLEKALKKKIYNFFEMQKNQVLKRLFKEGKSENYTDIYIRISDMWDNEDKVLSKATLPVMKNVVETGQQFALENIGIDRDVVLNEGLVLRRMNKITGINSTVWNQIKMNIHEGVTDGETIDNIAERIRGVYSMAKKRSITIARTEVTAGMNEAALVEYKENGVDKVEWLTAGDSDVREEHQANANAGPLPIGSTFPSGETYPSAPNCRCTISPVI